MSTYKNRKTRGDSLRLISKDLSDQASINSNDTPKFNLKLENAIEAIQDFQLELAENAVHTDNPFYLMVECSDSLDEALRALMGLRGRYEH